RGARDDARAQVRNRTVVDAGAERARREHVALDFGDVVDRGDRRAELALRALALELVDVGDGELRTLRVQLLAEVVADVTDALHRDGHAFQVGLAELELHARLDAATHAERGERRRIAGAAVRRIDAGDVLGHGANDLHVLEAGAAVLGGDVVP